MGLERRISCSCCNFLSKARTTGIDIFYNEYKLIFQQVDGEENPTLADKYKVEGYPTIKLVKGNQIIEYDAKPSLEHLKEFLNSTLA